MASSPSYTKYHEWRDHGYPYDVGVALLRELRLFPAFVNLAAVRRTPQTEAKLRTYLERYLAKVPGVPPPAPQPPADPPPPAGTATEPKAPGLSMAAQQAVATLPPKPEEEVPVYSIGGKKAVPFENLPEELKPGRMQAISDMSERERLHAALLPVPAAAHCIHFRDMLRLMEEKDPSGKPVPFTLKRFTYNRRTRMGGELITAHQAVLHTEASQANPRSYIERQASRAATGKDPSARHKPGSHWKNATRNLQMPDGSLDKCIIWLIVEINGKRVVMGRNPVPDTAGHEPVDLCRRIVQLSDRINAHWDACQLWADKGVLPFVPANLEAKLRGYTDDQLERYLMNTVNPQRYRAHKALRTAEGDAREMWARKLNEAEQARGIIDALREERKAAARAKAEQVLAKGQARVDKRKEARRARRARRAQKK